jgi:hypothetical protein
VPGGEHKPVSAGPRSAPTPRGRAIVAGGRFSLLLAALVLFLAVLPFVAEAPGRLRWVGAAFGGVLALALYAVSRSRRLLWSALAFGVPALAARAVSLSVGSPVTRSLTLALTAAFLAFVAGVILREVLRPGRVGADKIVGAVSVYLLLGLLWSFLFALLESWEPGSFRAAGGASGGLADSGADFAFVYHSFVTLTTLGYGDITPATSRAQTLSWLEAVVGQLFLAVTVATLVGLRISHSLAERQDRRGRSGTGTGP